MRILAQTTLRILAWSEFDFVFNRRRSRLGKEQASVPLRVSSPVTPVPVLVLVLVLVLVGRGDPN